MDNKTIKDVGTIIVLVNLLIGVALIVAGDRTHAMLTFIFAMVLANFFKLGDW